MDSEKLEKVIDFLRKHTPLPGTPMEKLRADFEKFYSAFSTHQKFQTKEVTIDQIPGLFVTASNVTEKGTLLFFHGGGFTIGSVESHLDLCARISSCAQMRVLGINYRKAPEHLYPAALEDCLKAYEWLLKEDAPIFLAGISSGGTLVLSVLRLIQEKKLKKPLAGICMSPIGDFRFQNASLDANAEKDWIYKKRLESIREIYAKGEDPENPLISPVFANYQDFPPLLIQVGKNELLLDDARHIAQKAEKESAHVKLEIWKDMIHCWHVFGSKIPEGMQAVENIGKYINERLLDLR